MIVMKMMIIMMSGLLKGLKSKCGGDCQMICITSKRRVDDDDKRSFLSQTYLQPFSGICTDGAEN